MAGVKGRSGGARPGAGRKKRETVVEQASRRDVVLQVFGDPEFRGIIEAWRDLAKVTPSVIYPLLPYILGAARQEINVTGQVEHVQIESARRVLRVVGGTERAS